MTYRIASICLALAVMLSPVFIGIANAESDRAHAETYVKDSAITTKVKAKLAEEKVRTLLDVKVETDSKGEVELSGTVASQAEIDKAVAIARAVAGVTSVKSELMIKSDK
ncbi:BON domain-containing protein [Magnetospirillum fulvum]|uniref:Hyperosmotically inducible protein n=1 Tax=Magnetospirillum fulvum TaxID=1082 RepID=A0A1H6H9G8_MAGFU|nr:BON domain-containing protein [Magnetospirillum fulvum]SEH30835.1 hyperosmotically inducible protein [Magnetospirillum fulvum]